MFLKRCVPEAKEMVAAMAATKAAPSLRECLFYPTATCWPGLTPRPCSLMASSCTGACAPCPRTRLLWRRDGGIPHCQLHSGAAGSYGEAVPRKGAPRQQPRRPLPALPADDTHFPPTTSTSWHPQVVASLPLAHAGRGVPGSRVCAWQPGRILFVFPGRLSAREGRAGESVCALPPYLSLRPAAI